MNRRTVLAAGVLVPSIAGAQTLSDQLRSVMEAQWQREAAQQDTILRVWAWVDKWHGTLGKEERMELLAALGPDPNVRIAE